MAASRAVMAQREADLGMGERDTAEHLVAMAELGRLALQEFAPCRRIEVEVLDRNRRAVRASRRRNLAAIAAFYSERAAVPILFAPRGDRQARDGGDGGKRLAAEAHGGDAFEIGEG